MMALKTVLCQVEGGVADGTVVSIYLGTRTIQFPRTEGGCWEYDVYWHDDGPVAR